MRRTIQRLLVVAAHGDDETLGAGGTIAKLADEGVTVALCVLTNDDGSRSESGNGVTNRISAIELAAKILGIERIQVNEFGDNRLDTVGHLELNRVVEREVRDFEPDTIFTTSMADLSVDHQLVSRAARVAGRPGKGSVKQIRAYEIRSATDIGEASGLQPGFRPNCWESLDEQHVDRKLEALRAYGKELEEWPNPRSERGVRALAEYRGSQVATGLAEAFEIVRTVHQ
ncbi:LmbE family N-acetylglucosaminyl deacetylase [Kibdelosporangium banguiense]|uniref:LmbE family N-acetylglucosaminyl deacetylase n=1 Tax=Kibdelosporangium banguiense TaxID=1365924 RepID=A0ABS4TT29_9PSEU|nr:PIG-L family deacetylase [Kibdelosporangium banguiense]MBP2327125.1 LmbE family N-acetylglucosaminyl deacetylase [Kibdelosporangium banguiense]